MSDKKDSNADGARKVQAKPKNIALGRYLEPGPTRPIPQCAPQSENQELPPGGISTSNNGVRATSLSEFTTVKVDKNRNGKFDEGDVQVSVNAEDGRTTIRVYKGDQGNYTEVTTTNNEVSAQILQAGAALRNIDTTDDQRVVCIEQLGHLATELASAAVPKSEGKDTGRGA